MMEDGKLFPAVALQSKPLGLDPHTIRLGRKIGARGNAISRQHGKPVFGLFGDAELMCVGFQGFCGQVDGLRSMAGFDSGTFERGSSLP